MTTVGLALEPSGYGERGRAPWPDGVPGWGGSWGYYVQRGLVVLDVDAPGVLASALRRRALPAAALDQLDRAMPWAVATRRGYHLFLFADVQGVVNLRLDGQALGELRGEGAWVHWHGEAPARVWPVEGSMLVQALAPRRAERPGPAPRPLHVVPGEWRTGAGVVLQVRDRGRYAAVVEGQALERATRWASRHGAALYLLGVASEMRVNGAPSLALHREALRLCEEARGRQGRDEYRRACRYLGEPYSAL